MEISKVQVGKRKEFDKREGWIEWEISAKQQFSGKK